MGARCASATWLIVDAVGSGSRKAKECGNNTCLSQADAARRRGERERATLGVLGVWRCPIDGLSRLRVACAMC